MQFEWDEAKRQSNIRKHGIDFAEVPPLFDGETVTVEDERPIYSETRYLTLGLLGSRVLYIVHTERNRKIRLISVRKASTREEVTYYQQVSEQLGSGRRNDRRRH